MTMRAPGSFAVDVDDDQLRVLAKHFYPSYMDVPIEWSSSLGSHLYFADLVRRLCIRHREELINIVPARVNWTMGDEYAGRVLLSPGDSTNSSREPILHLVPNAKGCRDRHTARDGCRRVGRVRRAIRCALACGIQ